MGRYLIELASEFLIPSGARKAKNEGKKRKRKRGERKKRREEEEEERERRDINASQHHMTCNTTIRSTEPNINRFVAIVYF
jgi:ribosomal protein L9